MQLAYIENVFLFFPAFPRLFFFFFFFLYSFFSIKKWENGGVKMYSGRVMKIIYVVVYSEMLGGIPRKYDLVGHLRCIGNGDEKRDRLHY